MPPSHSSGVGAEDASTNSIENAEQLSSASYENTLSPEVIALQEERSHRLAKIERSARLFTRPISAMLLAEPTIKKPPNTVFWIRLIRSRWLLVQLSTGVVELWNIDNANISMPIDSCHNIDGTIDNSVVEDDPRHRIVSLYLSTRYAVKSTSLRATLLKW